MALQIAPSLVSVAPGQTQTFVASGGAGGYVFAFLQNASNGTLNPSTGAYVAGQIAGTLDIIEVTDSASAATTAAVRITGVSLFQGIGLLPQPQIAQPLVAGDVLGNTGTVTEWIPQGGGGGGLPTLTPGFLTNNGAIASWAYPTPFDIRNYAAGPTGTIGGNAGPSGGQFANDPGGTIDCTTAFYDAIAAWTAGQPGPVFSATGGITFGEAGNFYISAPIVTPNETHLFGVGMQQCFLVPGNGDTTTPSMVQAFAGPLIYMTGPITPGDPTLFPAFSAPAVGSVGQSMALDTANEIIVYLHDAYVWSTYLGNFQTDFCVRFWVYVSSSNTGINNRPIITSLGPNVWTASGLFENCDQAFGIWANNLGSGWFLQAFLTTSTDGPPPSWRAATQYSISSSTITLDAWHNVELNYDGGHIDFYVDGVNQGHVAATGRIYKTPWEYVTIGPGGPEYLGIPFPTIYGKIFSLEFSKVARHTGTGSFSPPTSAYVPDSDTLALYNFLAPTPPVNTQPFIMGEAVCVVGPPGTYPTPPTTTVLMPHYMRVLGAGINPFGAAGSYFHDFGMVCNFNSGIVTYGCNRSFWQRVFGIYPGAFGLRCIEPVSFYCNIEDCYWYYSFNYGVLGKFDHASRTLTQGCVIGQHYLNGFITCCEDQPPPESFAPYVFGPGGGDYTETIISIGNAPDNEGVFPNQHGGAIVLGSVLGSFLSINDYWTSYGASGQSPLLFIGGVAGGAQFIGTRFLADPGASCYLQLYEGSVEGTGVLVTQPTFLSPVVPPQQFPTQCALSNQTGWATLATRQNTNNQIGISMTDTPAFNMCGEFQVVHGFTTGTATFLTPEADGNYDVIITPKSHVGSTPASNSWTITSYTTGKNGFTATTAADPGGSCVLTFSYLMIRTGGPVLLFEYVPTIPSTASNPLVTASPAGNFAVGVTYVPVTGNCIAWNGGGTELAADAGAGSNLWALGLLDGCRYAISVGGFNEQADSFVGVGTNQLGGLLNPGIHNVAVAYQQGTKTYTFYVDGLQTQAPFGVLSSITQATPIYIGENSSAGDSLTSVTLQNLKVDLTAGRVITFEPAAGPQSMLQAAFFGDEMSMGSNSSQLTGGAYTQIAQAEYGTTYWWFATRSSLTSDVLLSQFWNEWGTFQTGTLKSVVIHCGWWDIINGVSAATAWANLTSVLVGTYATTTFIPPTSNAGGTAVLIINGVSFNATFTTDANTTVNNLITLINASAPTLALVTPSNVSGTLLLTAVAKGTTGNGITTVTNALNGASVNHVVTSGGLNGVTTLPIPNIVLCTVPPFGTYSGWTSAKETQRTTLNTSIKSYVSGSGGVVTLGDVDLTLRDPAAHQNVLAGYLSGTLELNDAGQTALLVLIAPLLPQGAGAPTSLTYSTNPASYAHGSPITANTPSVTGTPTGYAVSPPLPAGLTISASTGHITGTPTTATAMATYTVLAFNATGATTVGVVITIT